MKLGAKELRVSEPTPEDLTKIKRREIYIICDNILDTYNTGSIFRLADAVAAKKVYLCGKTQTPPYHRISKAAVGTEKWVSWKYASTAVDAITDLKGKFSTLRSDSVQARSNNKYSSSEEKRNREGRLKIIAIEQSKKSVDFRNVDYSLPIAFIVGNETEGVSKGALKLADYIVEIPMFGVNKSLNVMVSLAIVLYRMV